MLKKWKSQGTCTYLDRFETLAFGPSSLVIRAHLSVLRPGLEHLHVHCHFSLLLICISSAFICLQNVHNFFLFRCRRRVTIARHYRCPIVSPRRHFTPNFAMSCPVFERYHLYSQYYLYFSLPAPGKYFFNTLLLIGAVLTGGLIASHEAFPCLCGHAIGPTDQAPSQPRPRGGQSPRPHQCSCATWPARRPL